MHPAASPVRRLKDRYTLTDKLGAGGQAEVWRARDEERGGEVALKVLRPEVGGTEAAWAALQHEAEVMRSLAHPAILKVEPPWRAADAAVLPMELATGGDLRRLRGAGYLEIVPVLLELAGALGYAHARGVVHGDLKPGNVLIDAAGHVKLADFGTARSALGAAHPARAHASPFSASPEQLRGEPPAVSDDIYGLGALAYELLSGYPPFYPRLELRRVLEEPVPPVRPVHPAPQGLTSLVMTMLSKQPRERPAHPHLLEAGGKRHRLDPGV